MQIAKRKWVNGGTNSLLILLIFYSSFGLKTFSKFSHFAELYCFSAQRESYLFVCGCLHISSPAAVISNSTTATADLQRRRVVVISLTKFCMHAHSHIWAALKTNIWPHRRRCSRIHAVSWYIDKYAKAFGEYLQTHTYTNYFPNSLWHQYLHSKYTNSGSARMVSKCH